MHILYVSSLVSSKCLEDIYISSKIKPLYSIQKFHRLTVEGLHKNERQVQVLSCMPISSQNNPKRVWNTKNEIEKGIKYHYIPFFNFKIIRQICVFVYAFFYTLRWGINGRKEKRIIYDVLNISVCMGSLIASKIIGVKSVAIVTDMPGMMVGADFKSFVGRIITFINKSYLGAFSYYVFLTEQMNLVINKYKRPYIVMEGVVDINMCKTERKPEGKVKNIIYAGGLYKRYGVKMLIDAFVSLDLKDVTMSLYGSGEMEDEIKDYTNKYNNIHFYGVVPNEVIVDEELRATLLVNPRPTHEEFTKYSFPSKNMEYMVSGTPVLTTKLPGMPVEYYDYVFLFDQESVTGYYEKLKEVLSMSELELSAIGEKAKQFVLEKKNNIVQAKRLITLLSV